MKDRMSLLVMEPDTNDTIIDFTGVYQSLIASSNTYGFSALSFSAPYLKKYTVTGIVGSKVQLGTGVDIVWEGRLEDLTVSENMINASCTGRWVATADYVVNSTYVVKGYDMWDVIRTNQYANAMPNKFGMSNDEGLYMTPKSGLTHDTDNYAMYGFALPEDDSESIVEIEFDYSTNLSSLWTVQCQAWTTPWTTPDAAGWTLAGNGTTQSGTGQVMAVSNKPAISFTLYNDTGETINSVEEDEQWVKFTNIVVRCIQDPVLTNDIAADIVGQASTGATASERLTDATKSIGISDSTDYIIDVEGVTAMDISDMRFEDATVQSALQLLAMVGNLDGDHVSTGVWEDGKVFFWLTDDWNTTWYINADKVTINESFEDMYNYIATQTMDDNARPKRLDASTNALSVERWGIEKQARLVVDNKCDCVTTSIQETFINKYAFPPPRIKIVLDDTVDAGYWRIRANDWVVVQNVAWDMPDSSVVFRVEKISFDASTRTVQIEPLFNPEDPDTFKTALQSAQDVASVLPKSHRLTNSA